MTVSVKEQLHEVLGHVTATQQIGCSNVRLASLTQAIIKLCHIQLQIEGRRDSVIATPPQSEERTNGT